MSGDRTKPPVRFAPGCFTSSSRCCSSAGSTATAMAAATIRRGSRKRHRLRGRQHGNEVLALLGLQEVQQAAKLRRLERVGAAVRVAIPVEDELDPQGM